MAKILIIGAHGKVAQLAIPLLAEAGHEVLGAIRNPEHADDITAAGATPVRADVENMTQDEIADLLEGTDVVLWSAGAGGGDARRTWAVDRDAAIRSMDAAAEAGSPHFVMVSYFGAGPDHGVPEDNSFYAYAEAKAAADEHLKASALPWTILRPSTLTLDEPTGRLDTEATEAGEVSRGNVARLLTAVVDNREANRGRIISFNDGETPVEQVAAG